MSDRHCYVARLLLYREITWLLRFSSPAPFSHLAGALRHDKHPRVPWPEVTSDAKHHLDCMERKLGSLPEMRSTLNLRPSRTAPSQAGRRRCTCPLENKHHKDVLELTYRTTRPGFNTCSMPVHLDTYRSIKMISIIVYYIIQKMWFWYRVITLDISTYMILGKNIYINTDDFPARCLHIIYRSIPM